MTWGEFKKLIDESEGVTDDIKIDYIDFNGFDADCMGIFAYTGSGELTIH